MSDTQQQRRDRILVVDDSPETLSLITDALEAADMTALVATSGAAALKLVQQIVPDLILMDAVMPGMDGFEVTRQLQQDVNTSHVPVIFMTGLSDTESVVEGLGAGGIDYVTKPIVIDELIARVRVHLAKARVAFGARTALDATGRSLFSIDDAGTLLWYTPQAGLLISEMFSPEEGRIAQLPPAIGERLLQLRDETRGGVRGFSLDFGTRRATFTYLSRIGPNESLYRLSEEQAGAREAILREVFNLTQREAEVLVWIAAGKSNRDISEILGISPRTVNKHLEQVFVKLGVENRATAAALAVRALAART